MTNTVIELSLNISTVIWFAITICRLKSKKISDTLGIFLLFFVMASAIYCAISNILILTRHP